MNIRAILFVALATWVPLHGPAADEAGNVRLWLDFERGRLVDDLARQGARFDGLPADPKDGAVKRPFLGAPVLQFEGGHADQRRVAIVDDPTRPGNHVLEFRVIEPNVEGTDIIGGRKARVQMNVYGNRGVTELYQSVRMRLDDGFVSLATSSDSFDWLTLSEWWNNAGWTGEDHRFRMTVDLVNRGPDGRAGLYLHVRATAIPPDRRRWSREVWSSASALFLPVRQWLTVETWVREGDAQHGRFVVVVTPDGGARKVAVDVTGFTHHPDDRHPDGYAQINPLKLYTSAAVVANARRSAPALSVQWDDLLLQGCVAHTGGIDSSDCTRAIRMR